MLERPLLLLRRHLDNGTRLREVTDGTEEQRHEVAVAPIDEGMLIEEATDSTCMWEIVVHGAKRLLKAMEARIHGQPCAIYPMPNLCVVVQEAFDRPRELLVPHTQCLEVLECSGNNFACVSEVSPVLG